MPLIYLIAGEASGDVLGARLMAALRLQRPDLDVAGIGGPMMAAQGLRSLFPISDLALMGFVEVLPRLALLRRRLAQAVQDITLRRPAAVVTIDIPGFALRVLRAIAPLGIKRAHYVAPQVWAWREGRARHFPGLWERLLCLLPFEPAFFARYNLPAVFVGHPVLESGADRGDARRFQALHGIGPDETVITVMPGSRRAEIGRLMPVLGAALGRLHIAGVRPVMPVADPVADAVRAAAGTWAVPPVLVRGQSAKHDAFAASAMALTKSGTSTLELALAGVPMVVAYRVNPASAAIARRLITVRHAALVNLLSPQPVVPELIQQDCTPDRLASALRRLLTEPEAAATQRATFAAVIETLRPPGGLRPSEAAAKAVVELIEQP